MAITGRSGFPVGHSSEPGRGFAGRKASTGTSITISTIAGDIVGRSRPEASVPPNTVSRSAAKRCITLAAVKLTVGAGKSFAGYCRARSAGAFS